MSYVTSTEVQQWLESTKLGVDHVDTELEDSAITYIKARVADTTDVSAWTDSSDTPALILKLVSMLVAAWIYERTYSESTSDQPSWAQRLERMVETILTGIAAGTISLVDDPSAPADTIAFLPDDNTGVENVYDALGNLIGASGSEDIKFTMGVKF